MNTTRIGPKSDGVRVGIFAVVVVAVLTGFFFLTQGNRPSEPKPAAAPPPSAASAAPETQPSVSSSPTPQWEPDVPEIADPGPTPTPLGSVESRSGYTIHMSPGAPDGAADLAAIGEKWITAYYSVDSSRPYPGKDLDALTSGATGMVRDDLRTQLRDWQHPRSRDKQVYDEGSRAGYRKDITIREAWCSMNSAKKPMLTYLYTASFSGGQGDTKPKMVQVVLEQDGGVWKVATLNESPQSP